MHQPGLWGGPSGGSGRIRQGGHSRRNLRNQGGQNYENGSLRSAGTGTGPLLPPRSPQLSPLRYLRGLRSNAHGLPAGRNAETAAGGRRPPADWRRGSGAAAHYPRSHHRGLPQQGHFPCGDDQRWSCRRILPSQNPRPNPHYPLPHPAPGGPAGIGNGAPVDGAVSHSPLR